MSPVRDPIKNLVFSASRHDLDTVIIDGQAVMESGKIPGFDEAAPAPALQGAAERLWRHAPERDWAHRGVDQISPRSLPDWRGD